MFEISRDMNPIEYSIKAIEEEQDLKDSDEKIEFIDNFRRYKVYDKKFNKEWCKYKKYYGNYYGNYIRLCNQRFIREDADNIINCIIKFLKRYLENIYDI